MADPARQPFQAFFDEHRGVVISFLRGMIGPDAVEDCAQETFLSALRAYPRFDGANPRAWVLTIARRKAIDHARSARRAPAGLEGVDELPAQQRRAEGMNGLDAQVWSSVAALPEGQRAAVLLRFAVDLRYREVGAALGCSEAAARRRVADGLAALRETFDHEEELR